MHGLRRRRFGFGLTVTRVRLLGCDFSSSPTARKPIVVADGEWVSGVVRLRGWSRYASLGDWATSLRLNAPWVCAFDLPFGLPRELVQTLGWPLDWEPCIRHFASLSRAEIREQFKAFCDARPVGSKFAHRATDAPAGSSPSMKWVNPPVAYMLHAGVPRLIKAGLHLPGLIDGDRDRVGLEAYPGMLARQVLGHRSYKSDDRAKQTPDRLIARKDLVHALEVGLSPYPRMRLSASQSDTAANDASGDSLDAVICLMQAAWGQAQHEAGHAQYGLPESDPLEGWIVGAVKPTSGS